MAIEMITKEDLEAFRIRLLNDIRELLGRLVVKPVKPWLKSNEVRKLLGISSNTIRRLRIAGKLRYSKVGGIYYYRYDDIEKLMNNK